MSDISDENDKRNFPRQIKDFVIGQGNEILNLMTEGILPDDDSTDLQREIERLSTQQKIKDSSINELLQRWRQYFNKSDEQLIIKTIERKIAENIQIISDYGHLLKLYDLAPRGSNPEKIIEEWINSVIHKKFHGNALEWLDLMMTYSWPDSTKKLIEDHLIIAIANTKSFTEVKILLDEVPNNHEEIINTAADTYVYLMKQALCNGELGDDDKEYIRYLMINYNKGHFVKQNEDIVNLVNEWYNCEDDLNVLWADLLEIKEITDQPDGEMAQVVKDHIKEGLQDCLIDPHDPSEWLIKILDEPTLVPEDLMIPLFKKLSGLIV